MTTHTFTAPGSDARLVVTETVRALPPLLPTSAVKISATPWLIAPCFFCEVNVSPDDVGVNVGVPPKKSPMTPTTSRESFGGVKLAVTHGSCKAAERTGVEASTATATPPPPADLSKSNMAATQW